MLTHPMLSIRILFTNYDIITDILNLAFSSEHFISIKHRILATFNINKKINSDSLCAFNNNSSHHCCTFSNISAISWRPVLVVEEAEVPGENHRPWASN
jgi:hypothetical protein